MINFFKAGERRGCNEKLTCSAGLCPAMKGLESGT